MEIWGGYSKAVPVCTWIVSPEIRRRYNVQVWALVVIHSRLTWSCLALLRLQD